MPPMQNTAQRSRVSLMMADSLRTFMRPRMTGSLSDIVLELQFLERRRRGRFGRRTEHDVFAGRFDDIMFAPDVVHSPRQDFRLIVRVDLLDELLDGPEVSAGITAGKIAASECLKVLVVHNSARAPAAVDDSETAHGNALEYRPAHADHDVSVFDGAAEIISLREVLADGSQPCPIVLGDFPQNEDLLIVFFRVIGVDEELLGLALGRVLGSRYGLAFLVLHGVEHAVDGRDDGLLRKTVAKERRHVIVI